MQFKKDKIGEEYYLKVLPLVNNEYKYFWYSKKCTNSDVIEERRYWVYKYNVIGYVTYICCGEKRV